MEKFREQFKKEKDFTYWAEGCNYGSFNDDYVNWLEKKLALTLTDVGYPLCACGGNERIAMDCTRKSCEHPKYAKSST